MVGIPSPFAGSESAGFDDYDEFVPAHLPEPGPFLSDQRVLDGRDHVEFHRITREIFETRSVYDVTFDYNLARLNLDRRHESAGYRYAEDRDDPSVLRAEFTPTTPFCPQSDTLAKGSFRAWNGLSDRHSYDLVAVRVDRSHQHSESINAELRTLEESVRSSGSIPGDSDGTDGSTHRRNPTEKSTDRPTGTGDPTDGSRTPF